MSKDIRLDIAVRAYTECPDKTPVGAKKASTGLDTPSDFALVFDCETTTDAVQRLRVGCFQLRKSGELEDEGLFYDPEAVGTDERAVLEDYAPSNGLELITVAEFRAVFLTIGYDLRGTIVGFNLPFDISRIALSHGEARRSMRGGFSFHLSCDRCKPDVRVKHLSRRAALIDFAVPAKQETPRGMRKRGGRTPHHRGYFIDIKTLAAALTSKSHSLGSLCRFLGTETQKQASEEHGAAITASYLDYARADVQATWESYSALMTRYGEHGLTTPAHRILSEASVGKAYLKDMGIDPLLYCQPEFPRGLFGQIMCSYYGGRAEVRLRRQIARVLYCDFKSMYPTVNALMGLWRFVIASGLRTREATDEAQAFLDRVTLADLKSPETWEKLTMIVRVHPDCDLLPTRAKYDGRSNTIGLNHLTCDGPLWYTLADCIAAKLLTGKAPVIEEAIRFEPTEPQAGLSAIDLFGKERYRVDPNQDDVFKRLVDLRDEAKDNHDPAERAIKIIANAVSYGIFIEINRDDAPKGEPVDVYGPDGAKHATTSRAIEEPGKYFNPLLGALITGAARLMLALAERLVIDQGLDWAFCDTDSLAIVKPDGMGEAEFMIRARRVIDWFEPLNPYQKPGSILKVEDANYPVGGGSQIVPLYCYAISAKRYALFNLDKEGRTVLRKASAHGLGHLIAPYGQDDAPADIPLPSVSLSEIGVERWQYDLWFKIIEVALSGYPDQVALDYHPALGRPAASRYGATSPRLLKWFKPWNSGRGYANQVKPFNFLISFQARNGVWGDFRSSEVAEMPGRGRPRKPKELSPVAPFHTDTADAATRAFDRVSGEPVSIHQLKTYAEALAQYHLSPEPKFAHARYFDRGQTERRHVVASNVRLIGKEGHRVEEDGLTNGSDLFQISK